MGIMGAAADIRPQVVVGERQGEPVQLRLVRSAPVEPPGPPGGRHEPGGRHAPEDRPVHLDLVVERDDRSREDQVTDLFRLHSASLTRLAGLLTSDRSAAEEVVQDAFVGLHRKLGDIRDPGLALAYLRASVVNGSRSKLRRRRTERAHIPPYLPPAASAEDGAMAREEHAQVRAGMSKLPRRQREVLVLRYHLDLSEAEIADTLGISRGAVKGYASRALAALGAHLEGSR